MSCGCNEKPLSNTQVQSTCGTSIGCNTPNLSCVTDDCFKQYVSNLEASIKIVNAWNVPACGKTATIYFSDVGRLAQGAYIWSSTYGYFEITSFDPVTKKAMIINNCNLGTQNIGKFVPACSTFILAPAPGIISSGLDSFLLSDFIAPAVDVCINVIVTSTLSLSTSSVVSIGTATYFISEIIDEQTITICNAGGGFTVGTPVFAFNSLGILQYKLIRLNTGFVTQSNNFYAPISAGFKLSEAAPFVSVQTTLLLSNPSNKAIDVYFNAIGSTKGGSILSNSLDCSFNMSLELDVLPTALVYYKLAKCSQFGINDNSQYFSKQLGIHGVITIPAFDAYSLFCDLQLNWIGTPPAPAPVGYILSPSTLNDALTISVTAIGNISGV